MLIQAASDDCDIFNCNIVSFKPKVQTGQLFKLGINLNITLC